MIPAIFTKYNQYIFFSSDEKTNAHKFQGKSGRTKMY